VIISVLAPCPDCWEISHLWEPPEWSNFSNSAHNRLQFSLKLPKQRRFTALKGLEIECREIDGDWYILDERSGGTIVDQLITTDKLPPRSEHS
jgi:hypothetical protein